MDQYKQKGPILPIEFPKDNDNHRLQLRIEQLEAKIRKQDSEISRLRKDVGRLKSDLQATVDHLRNRG